MEIRDTRRGSRGEINLECGDAILDDQGDLRLTVRNPRGEYSTIRLPDATITLEKRTLDEIKNFFFKTRAGCTLIKARQLSLLILDEGE
jgi:hypothetical protein